MNAGLEIQTLDGLGKRILRQIAIGGLAREVLGLLLIVLAFLLVIDLSTRVTSTVTHGPTSSLPKAT